ncbi:alkaline phosphatase [Pseudoalteromonas xiamenensis]
MKFIKMIMLGYWAALLCACSSATPTQTTQVKTSAKIKNVILMIGDGMGPQQVGLLQEYTKRAPQSIYHGQDSAIVKLANLGVVGMSLHGPADRLVVDSACSATQLATGEPAGNEMIGLNRQGMAVHTILEKAKAKGKATGLVSDTRITHATPAAFAAHQIHRSKENDIALEMLTNGQVDVMLSGGLRHFLPKGYTLPSTPIHHFEQGLKAAALPLTSKRTDAQNVLLLAEQSGYEFAFSKQQLNQAKSTKVLGLFASSAMADAIESKQGEKPNEPTLSDMAMHAVKKLSQNDNGFFLMIEGGQIDWAGHNNDAGTLLNEMVKFDTAVEAVLNWAAKRDDTLVVVTADHETGGFGFSYNAVDLPQAEVLANPNHDRYQPNFNFGQLEVLDKLFTQSKSYQNMWSAAKALKTPLAENLVNVVNAASEFKIAKTDAETILATSKNAFFKRGHSSLGSETASTINDFSSFYVYLAERPLNLIGRALSAQQNIVWSTGTHTHTPVGVFAFGPKEAIRPFGQMQTHVELGKKLQTALNLE